MIQYRLITFSGLFAIAAIACLPSCTAWAQTFAGFTDNAFQVAAGVNEVAALGQTGNIGELYGALSSIGTGDPDGLAAAFNQLHGEIYAVSYDAVAQMQRRFLRQLPSAKDRMWIHPKQPEKWQYGWGMITSDHLNRNKIGEYGGYYLPTAGVAVGIDRMITKNLYVGKAFSFDNAYQRFWSFDSFDQIDSYRGMLYGGWFKNSWFADVYIGYTRDEHKTRRDINFGSGTREFEVWARGDFDDNMTSAGVTVGREYQWDDFLVTPSIGIHSIYVDRSEVTEFNGRSANLVVNRGYYNSLRMPVGAKVRCNVATRLGLILTPEIRGFYVRELSNDQTHAWVSFEEVPSVNFIALSGKRGRDMGRFGVGFEAQTQRRVSFRIDYDYEIYSHTQMGEFSATMNIRW